jgi:triosephosphate isomerase (TIM)
MTKLIVGNWKMNGLQATLGEVTAIISDLSAVPAGKVKVVICPPATLISLASGAVTGTRIGIGGQDCHAQLSGPHTGDISAQMLSDVGASYVIVGHSERRTDHLESSNNVQAKAATAHQAGLTTIICVGESEVQRDAGHAEIVVLDQLSKSIPLNCGAGQLCIAYEPVWAIGTGRTPNTHDVAAMHQALRLALKERFGDDAGQSVAILYGGSVNSKNASELLSIANVDGALVGGASLTAANFLGIINTQL